MDFDELRQIIIETVCNVIKSIDELEIENVIDDELEIEIDSVLGAVLVGELEERLGVSLPDDFINTNNCSSVRKITQSFIDSI